MAQLDAVQEKEWLLLARGGDVEAFAPLVAAHQRVVYRIALRITGNPQEAEDVAQEAFVRAFERLDRFDPARPFAPWLYRIVHNLALNRVRRDRTPAVLGDWLEDERGTGPEAAAIAAETLERLRQAIAGLPENYRRVIVLRHFEGLSYQQMCAALGVPLSDVKSWLFRARRALQKSMG